MCSEPLARGYFHIGNRHAKSDRISREIRGLSPLFHTQQRLPVPSIHLVGTTIHPQRTVVAHVGIYLQGLTQPMAAEMTGYFQTEIEEGDNRKNSPQKIGCTETKYFGNVST